MTDVSGQVGTNLVATYKALGGGWQIRRGQPLLLPENRNEMADRTNWGGLLDPVEIEKAIDEESQRNVQWPDW